jgi:hypothetical protein
MCSPGRWSVTDMEDAITLAEPGARDADLDVALEKYELR